MGERSKKDSNNNSDDDEQIKEPAEVDVLCGRGGMSNHHPGNEWYRRLIKSNRPLYRACPKHTKLLVSKAIVQAVEQQGGRFLEKDRKRGSWSKVAYKRAVDKTSQGLRERERDEDPSKQQNEPTSAVPEQFSGKAEVSLSDLADVAIAHAQQSSGLPRSASDLPKRPTPAITMISAPVTKKARISESNSSSLPNAQVPSPAGYPQLSRFSMPNQNLHHQQQMGPPLGLSSFLGNQDTNNSNAAPLPPQMQARNSSMFRLLRQTDLLSNESSWGAGTVNNMQNPTTSFPLSSATSSGQLKQPPLSLNSFQPSGSTGVNNLNMTDNFMPGVSNTLSMFPAQQLAMNGLAPAPSQQQFGSTAAGNAQPPALTRLATQMSDWLETFWPVPSQVGAPVGGTPGAPSLNPAQSIEVQALIQLQQNANQKSQEQFLQAQNALKTQNGFGSSQPGSSLPPQQSVFPPPMTGKRKFSTDLSASPPRYGTLPSQRSGTSDHIPEPSDLEKAVSTTLLNLATTPSKMIMAGLSSLISGSANNNLPTQLSRSDTETAAAIPPPPPSRVAAGKVSKDSLLDDHEETADEARLRTVPTAGLGWQA